MTRRTLRFVRWGIFLAAGIYLYLRLSPGQSTDTAWRELWASLVRAPGWFWPFMVGLTVLNWGMEAAKWKWLMAPLERLGLGRAFTATLAGTSIGLVTPNRTGEFMGRILFLAPENRWQGAFATVLGSISQFVTTIIAGGLALAPWWGVPGPRAGLDPWWGMALAVLAATVALGTLLLYFRPQLLQQLVLLVPLLRRLGPQAGVLGSFSSRELMAVLWMSMGRYAVFLVQYVLFLKVFAHVGWGIGLSVVPVIFLVVTLIPTMLLSELGVRGSVAVALLAPLGVPAALVLLASVGVWFVNLALPALAGTFIMLVARIRTRP